MIGIHPHNQVPAFADVNLYASDPVLRAAVARGGAGWRDAELLRQGAEYGSAEVLQAGEDANRHEPELRVFSPQGERLDEVRFHPAWHRMMAIARRNGIANLPYVDERPSAWSAYGASLYLHAQVESGSTCPSVMTKACIPLLRRNAALDAAMWPRLASLAHDPRDIPLLEKASVTVGMGMTEKQGGSDLRSNTTRAQPSGRGPWGDEYLVTGHKWFFSAPMCDGHLVLAKTGEEGASCFFLPRWRPDGTKNAIRIQRLKDKLGNRSNASSEVEFDEAFGVLVGDAGRGIPTLIEMATYTRLDCALSSAGFMRQAFVQALHYARERFAFGKRLVEQPLMTEVLADLALESTAATLLAMELAAQFGSDTPLAGAWRRLLTPAAKFWICKRAIGLAAEAMEVFGGNGYVETAPMARLLRETPVNSIWEGSGNVMCLDVLRAVARAPEDAERLLEQLAGIASQDARVAAHLAALAARLRSPPADLERQARRVAQDLVLAAQACLLLQHAGSETAHAFIGSRFEPGWGAVAGVVSGTLRPQALLDAAWH